MDKLGLFKSERGVESKILDRLEEWEQREGRLPQVIEFYREILQIQNESKRRITVRKPSLADSLMQDRLREGIPLLLFKEFSPEWQQVQTVFEQVVVWTAKGCEDYLEEGRNLVNIGRNRSLLRRVARAWYQGRSLIDIARAQRIDDQLLNSTIAATLKPFLSVYATLLLPKVEQELWRRRYCPICGGKPDFAYLDKERGARWLFCSHCDSKWLFQRLECPYCGEQNQDDLAYFTDDKRLHRLYVCEQCHTYIKAIELGRAESEVLLPLERVMTLDMDKQAQEKGYKPGHSEALTRTAA